MSSSRPALRLALLGAAASALLLLGTPAQALTTATQTIVYTFSLTGAGYETGGGSPSLDIVAGAEIDELITEIGGATTSGSSSILVNGVAPLDPEDFAYGVGDVITVTLMSAASAFNPGDLGAHVFDAVLFFDFEDESDPTRNVLLSFDWSYSRDFVLTNMNPGDETAADIFSAGLVFNFAGFSDDVFTADVLDEHVAGGTVIGMPADGGSFQFLMDTEGGTAPQTGVEYTIAGGVSAEIVPEPSVAAFAALAVLTLMGARRRPR